MTNDNQKPDNNIPETTPENGEQEVTIESLQAEIADMKDQWLRAAAETENVRRRSIREKEDAAKYAITNFSRDIVNIADNLRRALENCPPTDTLSDALKALVTGLDLTEAELLNTLERHGIKKLNPLHEKFDPHFHQAMFEVETSEYEAGVILEVLQVGYVLHDRLLRPALVGVAKVS